ncbi:hypothetical protein [Agromyces sp. ISL-38]|uniref:hypothetical protein n=1 Tax=Agromyces sp. ISL-38 TaxID=2819107 RepID=UPI002035D7EA|nr:hypothetical protein [Agromyces sp. ISL-38]
MSVHLIGGGATTGADAALYAPFVAEAALRAGATGRARPRVAVISLHPEAEEKAAALGELLAEAGRGAEIEVHLTAGRPGEPIGLGAIADVDGIAVGAASSRTCAPGSSRCSASCAGWSPAACPTSASRPAR